MRTNLKHALKIFCLLMLLPVIVRGQERVSAVVEHQIDSIFSQYENKPGCVIAVIKNGEALFKKGYGLANLEYDIPINTKTVFEAGALAKQIVATCVFLLEKEGKLNLDDPIQKFIPEFPEYKEGIISIKNLLYQSSGLRSYLAILFSQNRYFGDKLNNDDVLKLVMNQRNLNFQVGSRQDLSNSNYVLLANIIEDVSEKTLNEYATERIFEPLDMNNTFFLKDDAQLIKNRAIAYEQNENIFTENHFFNNSVIGDGGLYSNLDDLIKWSKNLSKTPIWGDSIATKLITPGTLNSGEETIYAGGMFKQDHYDIEGLPSIRHSGDWGGFRSLYYKFLNQDTVFIFLSNNASTHVWGLLDELTPLFLADEIAQAEREAASGAKSTSIKEVKLRKKDLQQFSGNFYNTINGTIRSVDLVDGKLLYKRAPNTPGSPLSTISSNELIFEALPFIKLSFGEKHKTMVFTVHNRDPIPFKRYESYVYDQKELKEYENDYYNEDLNVTYQIKSVEDQLRILIEGKELVVLSPFTKDMFREEHFGYITFQRDKTGKIKSFSRTDNTFTDLVFHALKSTTS